MGEIKKYTMKELAERYNVRRHQVRYALDEYRIDADERVGNVNFFYESTLPQIAWRFGALQVGGRRMSDTLPSKYLNENEVLAFLPIKACTLRRWRLDKTSGPPWVKLGSRVAYPLDKLNEYLAANTTTPTKTGEVE